MATRSRSSTARASDARWIELAFRASFMAFPVWALQGLRLRQRAPRLLEPPGPTGHERCERDLDVLVVGDSSVAGVGVDHLDQALAARLAACLRDAGHKDLRWLSVGLNGGTTRDLVEHLNTRVDDETRARCVVVSVGVNDATGLRSRRGYLDDLEALSHRLDGVRPDRVVFSSLPPVHRFSLMPQPLRLTLGLSARRLDRVLRGHCQRRARHHFCEVAFADDPRMLAADGMHPSALGYADWSRQLASEVATGLR